MILESSTRQRSAKSMMHCVISFDDASSQPVSLSIVPHSVHRNADDVSSEPVSRHTLLNYDSAIKYINHVQDTKTNNDDTNSVSSTNSFHSTSSCEPRLYLPNIMDRRLLLREINEQLYKTLDRAEACLRALKARPPLFISDHSQYPRMFRGIPSRPLKRSRSFPLTVR